MKRATVAALLALLVGLGAACGLLENEVATAEVGDCIDNELEGQEISSFDVVDCDETHTAELYYKFDLPDGDFPGIEQISTAVQEECLGSNFEDYVGIDFASSELDVLPVTPTEQTWDEADDREVLCFGANIDRSELTESIEGSAR